MLKNNCFAVKKCTSTTDKLAIFVLFWCTWDILYLANWKPILLSKRKTCGIRKLQISLSFNLLAKCFIFFNTSMTCFVDFCLLTADMIKKIFLVHFLQHVLDLIERINKLSWWLICTSVDDNWQPNKIYYMLYGWWLVLQSKRKLHYLISDYVH